MSMFHEMIIINESFHTLSFIIMMFFHQFAHTSKEEIYDDQINIIKEQINDIISGTRFLALMS